MKKKLIPALLCLIVVVAVILILILTTGKKGPEPQRTTAYVASGNLSETIYRAEEGYMYVERQLPRGTAVTSRNLNVAVNDGEYEYTQIELEGENDEDGNPLIYYIESGHLAPSIDQAVIITDKYVRTSVTVYENTEDPKIASFLKKGTKLSVCGYYGLNPDGSVEMYQIDNPGSEGYVFAKYIVDSQQEADAVYTEIYNVHAGREFAFELYGGSPENLDWFPFERVELSSGPILKEARGMYLCTEATNPDTVDEYINLALESGVNCMVVDIKDGWLTYNSDVAYELNPYAAERAYQTAENLKITCDKLKEAGFYTIGRIAVFNDAGYTIDNPEDSIEQDGESTLWPSVYSRDCWYYNVCLAIESAKLCGFDEIQFDYVRFPESSYGMSDSGTADFKNTYDEEKAEAVQNFCFYAVDMLHREGIYMSVDVFGECVEKYVTAYGQYWPAITNVVDAISGMPYTDHFGSEIDTWSDPYTTMYNWSIKASVAQAEVATPAIARTWVTGYDTPNWNPVVPYNNAELITQVQALYDAELMGGFIPWNGASNIEKYREYSQVWADQY